MSSVSAPAIGSGETQYERKVDLNQPMSPLGIIIFGAIIAIGLFFVAYMIFSEVETAGAKPSSVLPYLLLAVGAARRARLRVRQRLPRHRQRGRHRDLHPRRCRRRSPWCGRALFNLPRRARSRAALVAFGIVSLLPVELILQVGSGAGFAMVFALLIAAIIWNLGTWCARPAGVVVRTR